MELKQNIIIKRPGYLIVIAICYCEEGEEKEEKEEKAKEEEEWG